MPKRYVTLSYRRSGLQLIGTVRTVAVLGSGSFDPKLELNTGGERWRDVTPARVRRECSKHCWFELENAFFLNPSVGWVTVWNVITLEDDVYRTTDGGGHWQLELRTEHTDNAGAQTVVWFINRRDGWVAALQPTGPVVSAWRTHDGGATWRQLPQNRTLTKSRRFEGWSTAPFEFITAKVGYAADRDPSAVDFGSGLAKTTDGGWIWTEQTVPLPAWSRPQPGSIRDYPFYELPKFSSADDGVLPILLPGKRAHAAVLSFYITTDQGAHWALRATLPVSTRRVRPPQQTFSMTIDPIASIVNFETWWVAVPPKQAADGGYTFRVTRNAGRSWTTTHSNLFADVTQLISVSPTHASATTEVFDRQGNSISQVAQTSDGGSHWTTVDAH